MNDDKIADVIPLHPGIVRDSRVNESLAGLPQSGKLGDSGKCWEHAIVVDVDARLVSCSTCSKLLDPFEALGLLCRAPDRWRWLHNDTKRLHEEIADLKRQRANARAAVKRAERGGRI